MTDLFHLTPCRNLDDIKEEGIHPGKPSPSMQRVDGDVELHETPPSELAQQKMDELMRDAQREAGRTDLPIHDTWESAFFFPDERTAVTKAQNSNIPGRCVVVVDTEKMSSTCAGGDMRDTDRVFERFWDTYRTGGQGMSPEEERELYEEMVEWWKEEPCDLEEPECTPRGKDEVWCDGEIPSDAIVHTEEVN